MRTLADRLEHVLTCFLEISAPFLFKAIYWLTIEFHRRKICLPLPANRTRDFLSESANGILWRSSQRHLLSLRRESEPVKKSKKSEKKNPKNQKKTDTLQKPLESLSGNLSRLCPTGNFAWWSEPNCWLQLRVEHKARKGRMKFFSLVFCPLVQIWQQIY